MATLPTTTSKAVGSKVQALDWNTYVKGNDDFFISNRPICVLKQNVAQTAFASATNTSVIFDTEVVDRDNQHSTVSNLSRINIGNTLGWYRVTGHVAFAGSAAGNTRRVSMFLNPTITGETTAAGGTVSGGTQYEQTITFSNATTNLLTVALVTTYVQATSASDFIILNAWQDTGGTLATGVSGTFRSTFAAEWIGS